MVVESLQYANFMMAKAFANVVLQIDDGVFPGMPSGIIILAAGEPPRESSTIEYIEPWPAGIVPAKLGDYYSVYTRRLMKRMLDIKKNPVSLARGDSKIDWNELLVGDTAYEVRRRVQQLLNPELISLDTLKEVDLKGSWLEKAIVLAEDYAEDQPLSIKPEERFDANVVRFTTIEILHQKENLFCQSVEPWEVPEEIISLIGTVKTDELEEVASQVGGP